MNGKVVFDMSEIHNKFGGRWTIEKLNILSDYLDFYVTALKNQSFNKLYIDAFAGTGHINTKEEDIEIEGSAKLALKVTNPFDEYIFIEKKKSYAKELLKLKNEFKRLSDRIIIKNEDCNETLKLLCRSVDWYKNRAVLLLDPYAASVKWETLKIVAATGAIDVWYLFPFSAATRMMARDGKSILPSWKVKLDSLFGEDDWFNHFYKKDMQLNFFNSDENYYKDANIESMKNYICGRLRSIFPVVAKNPRVLYNKKNCPLFLFCFAVSSKRASAQKLAIRGANYILNYSGR